MPRTVACTVVATAIILLVALTASPLAVAQGEEATPTTSAAPEEAAAAARGQDEALERAFQMQQEELDFQRGGFGGRAGRAGRGGRGRRGSGISPELLEQLQQAQGLGPATAGEVMAQRGGRAGRDRAAAADIEAPPADEDKDVITVNVWVLTVSASRDQMADDLVAKLAVNAANLPPVVGSTDELRALIEKLKVAELLEGVREFRILALDGESGTVQFGETAPRVQAVSINARGRSSSINQISIGTNIQVLPRAAADHSLQVSLQYTNSDVEKAPDVVIMEDDQGNQVLADRMKNRSINTTVRLRSGSVVVVQSDSLTQSWGQKSSGVRTELILLGATIVPVLD